MSEMVERVARAGCEASDIHLKCTFPTCGCQKAEKQVRTEIAAMREPTPEMIEAGIEAILDGIIDADEIVDIRFEKIVPTVWQCMNAAMLAGGKRTRIPAHGRGRVFRPDHDGSVLPRDGGRAAQPGG